MSLNARQQAFVEHYLRTLNASEAARAAGYSAKTAGRHADYLLKNQEISAAIAAGKEERSKRTQISADRVLEELARIAFLDVASIYRADGTVKSLAEMDEDARRAIAAIESTEIRDSDGATIGVTRKVKLNDKMKALEMIGRHLGMWNDKLKLQGDVDNPLALLIQQVQGNAMSLVRLDKAA